MKVFKILNLYACIGGNRYKWDEITEVEVTAVEKDPYLADMYKYRFPKDNVIIADAHEYLINNFNQYDFIWSSPPCPTHSRARFSQKNKMFFKPKYPDLKLYEEIILLDKFYNGLYCVENVIPYYKQLLPGKKRGKHIFWTNFPIPKNLGRIDKPKNIDSIDSMCSFHQIDLSMYKGKQRKNKIARNLVDYEVGKSILEAALKMNKKTPTKQLNFNY